MSILVSYIPTAEGWAALHVAIGEATIRGTPVVIVNVAIRSNFADVTFADEKDLDAVRDRLATEGIACEIVQVLDATDVAEAVLQEAAARETELIVVGLRRRSPVGKALLGSNAQKIIVAAACPVLSVRPD
ncbi:MAG: UspA protein [Aeromicrobium sp.]|nr:UspA protein [Aeromicrobium sp.]